MSMGPRRSDKLSGASKHRHKFLPSHFIFDHPPPCLPLKYLFYLINKNRYRKQSMSISGSLSMGAEEMWHVDGVLINTFEGKVFLSFSFFCFSEGEGKFDQQIFRITFSYETCLS